MGAAFGWGLLAASSLVIGAIAALLVRIERRVDRPDHGLRRRSPDQRASRSTSSRRRSTKAPAMGAAAAGSSPVAWSSSAATCSSRVRRCGPQGLERRPGGGLPLAIVLGTVLDGIPESLVIGLTIVEGGAVGTAYLAAVFISNLPEAISSTAGLVGERLAEVPDPLDVDRDRARLGLASFLGYSLFEDASPDTVAFILTFAAGGILAMLAETMMPEAFEQGHKLVGIATTLGFVVAFGIHQLD